MPRSPVSQSQSPSASSASPAAPLRAVAFDAYGTLFDVHSVGVLAEQLYPGHGQALSLLWRERQIEYTRLRTLSGRYKPFWDVTVDALRFACARLGLSLTDENEQMLMRQYACLSAFPENLSALRQLRALGIPLAILTNGNPVMVDIAVRSASMQGLFEHVLTADSVQRYKTAPEVYELAPRAFGLPAAEILFVSSNGWDACGATWFGFTTFWVNRAGQPPEELGVLPHYTGYGLNEVVEVVRAVC